MYKTHNASSPTFREEEYTWEFPGVGKEDDRACLEKPKVQPWTLASLEGRQSLVRQTSTRILTREHRCFACKLGAVSLDRQGREVGGETGLAGQIRTFQLIGRSSGRIERWYLLPEHRNICISFYTWDGGRGEESRDNSGGDELRLFPTQGLPCSP